MICTDELHYLAWKQLADRLGIPFSREQGDRCRGVSRMDSLEIVLEQAGRPYSLAEKEAFAQEKNQAYRAMLSNLSPADVPGEVVPTLKQLRQRGYRLALASGSKNAGLILERTGLGAWLDAVADGTQAGRAAGMLPIAIGDSAVHHAGAYNLTRFDQLLELFPGPGEEGAL